ncbi:hypothetical protein HMPREF0991_02687 [Lachnospiraceae bacterium 2_1_58FAA]|nr:hypothetical protein HMPREF0991_02687 [Lachnospiraceae bacterium 2_1_58FAA]
MIMVIASNIMRYMEEKRVTVIDIVLNTSFSRYDIERILSGELMICPCGLKEIATVLGVSKKDLMKG